MASAAIAQKRKFGATMDECRVQARGRRGRDRSERRTPRISERTASGNEAKQPDPDQCAPHSHAVFSSPAPRDPSMHCSGAACRICAWLGLLVARSAAACAEKL